MRLTSEPKQRTGQPKGSTGVESPFKAVYGEEIHVNGRKSDLPLQEAIVVEFPAIFEGRRIVGLLSPQLLAPARLAAILDLRVPRLSFGPPPLSSAGTRVCRNSDSPFVNRRYAAPVSSSKLESLMLVDTGATSSVAVPSSALAVSLSGRASGVERTQGVGGTSTMTPKVPNVQLHFGGGKASVSLFGGAPPTCGGDGLLGMDALRECRLIKVRVVLPVTDSHAASGTVIGGCFPRPRVRSCAVPIGKLTSPLSLVRRNARTPGRARRISIRFEGNPSGSSWSLQNCTAESRYPSRKGRP